MSQSSTAEQTVTSADLADAQPVGMVPSTPLFRVATHKFIVLSICTFGIYQFYWFYMNWKVIKEASGERLSPFWRTAFAPFWGFALFTRMRDIAGSAGVPTAWNPRVLAAAYFALNALWRLPDPWWLLSFASLLPMIPVQRSAQQANGFHGRAVGMRNDRYTRANVATIIIGGGLFLLALVGTLWPES